MLANVKELRAHLSEYLERAEQGEIITIYRHNRPIAKLVPTSREIPLTDLAGQPGIVWTGGKPENLIPVITLSRHVDISEMISNDRR